MILVIMEMYRDQSSNFEECEALIYNLYCQIFGEVGDLEFEDVYERL